MIETMKREIERIVEQACTADVQDLVRDTYEAALKVL